MAQRVGVGLVQHLAGVAVNDDRGKRRRIALGVGARADACRMAYEMHVGAIMMAGVG